MVRPELVGRITGLRPGERLTATALSSLLSAPEGLFKGTPGSAERVVFLNKLDTMADRDQAWELALRILKDAGGKIEKVLIGSLREGVFFIGGEE